MRQRKKVIMKTTAAAEGACISRMQSGIGMEHQPHLPEGQMGTGTGSPHTHPLQPLPLLEAPDGFHTLLMSSCASLGHVLWHLWAFMSYQHLVQQGRAPGALAPSLLMVDHSRGKSCATL